MKSAFLYRIACVLLILFAAGHTVGFLRFRPPTAEGLAVRNSMDNVRFQVRGHTYSYGSFFRASGFTVAIYCLLAAALAWHMGGMTTVNPQAIRVISWIFFASQAAIGFLSWLYLAPLVTVFAGVIAATLGGAAWLAMTSTS